MEPKDLNTKEENTWCPGCANFGILQATKEAISELTNEKKIKVKNVTIVSGIGCHAKIYDYLNTNAFYSLHGRVLPTCFGIKIGNPKLTVIGFGGDGDTYAEGISHFIHNCRYNLDMTMIVHNNQVFALTTGQFTPTSEKGFISASSPLGIKESPLNPIELALVSGATFVARGYATDVKHLKNLIKEAINHRGFSFIDVLQPCLTFHNALPYFNKYIYKLDSRYNFSNHKIAQEKAKEWDYCYKDNVKIPIGIFYKVLKPTYEDQWSQFKKPWHQIKRKINFRKVLEEFK